MADGLKIGDTVYLKSNGPPMTVTKIDDVGIDVPTVSCSWFDGKKPMKAMAADTWPCREYFEESYPAAALTTAQPTLP